MYGILDLDECVGVNRCHANAQCTNTDGSYTCSCLDGYTGNGKNCTGKCFCATCLKSACFNLCRVPFTVVISNIKVTLLTIIRLTRKSSRNELKLGIRCDNSICDTRQQKFSYS